MIWLKAMALIIVGIVVGIATTLYIQSMKRGRDEIRQNHDAEVVVEASERYFNRYGHAAPTEADLFDFALKESKPFQILAPNGTGLYVKYMRVDDVRWLLCFAHGSARPYIWIIEASGDKFKYHTIFLNHPVRTFAEQSWEAESHAKQSPP